MDEYSNTAVDIKNATKSFGKGPVLENLNMHVEKGIIYGLLGSSGCGKTTLLNCIVGRKKLDSGTVWVLGGPPGSSQSAVPGPRIGYMPQEVGLIAEFTVKSAIYYFGRIFCMNDKEINNRFQELTQLLDLPPENKYIAHCSGGQQRRVSFAAALVSTPELLVLDEPTVGLDPLLREGIWEYLIKLTNLHSTSVIITTHYIEEARQAHKIGLMRQGKLLAQESPENLLSRFQSNSLEDAFLILSTREAQQEDVHSAVTNLNTIDSHSSSTLELSEIGNSRQILTTTQTDRKNLKTNTANVYSLNIHRLKALIGKSWIQISNNYSGVGFMFIFPIFQMLAFFLAVGGDVKDISVAINNEENHFGMCDNFAANQSAMITEEGDCIFQQLGCAFLNMLDDSMINKVYYNNTDDALNSVQRGKATGVISIPENFTGALHDKIFDSAYDNTTLVDGQIQVWLDMSNHQIGGAIKIKLIQKMVDFQKSLISKCNYSSSFGRLPINFDEYMYGKQDDTFTVFMAPGVILTSAAFFAATNAATIMLTDRLEGIWDRSIVAGVSTLEIVLVHLVSQFIIMSIQLAIILVVCFPVYKIENNGSYVAVIIIALLAGLYGISFGFLVSVLSNGHTMSHILTTGGFFPLILLTGLMWPIEGMPVVLQWFSLCMPVTLAITSLRNVMHKGWSIFHSRVIGGIGVEILWIVILAVISIIQIKRKR